MGVLGLCIVFVVGLDLCLRFVFWVLWRHR